MSLTYQVFFIKPPCVAAKESEGLSDAKKTEIKTRHTIRATKASMWGTGVGGILHAADHVLSYIGKAGVFLLEKGMEGTKTQKSEDLRDVRSHFATVVDFYGMMKKHRMV